MTILWCGGEDIDFAGNGVLPTVNIGVVRAGFSRCALYTGANPSTGTSAFAQVTSVWLSARGVYAGTTQNMKDMGLIDTATGNGIFVGRDYGSPHKWSLWKLVSGVWTKLAVQAVGTVVPGGGGVYEQTALQIVNLGATCTLNLYQSGTLALTWTGDTGLTGVIGLDRVCLPANMGSYLAEFIVADEDPRLFSLVTLAPKNDSGETAAALNQWSGTYANVNEVVTDDASVAYSDVSGQDFQTNLSNLPAGQFVMKGVKVAARMSRSPTGVSSGKLGVKTNGQVNVGSQVALNTAWSAQERMLALNPVTGTTWTAAEVNDLILDIQTGA